MNEGARPPHRPCARPADTVATRPRPASASGARPAACRDAWRAPGLRYGPAAGAARREPGRGQGPGTGTESGRCFRCGRLPLRPRREEWRAPRDGTGRGGEPRKVALRTAAPPSRTQPRWSGCAGDSSGARPPAGVWVRGSLPPDGRLLGNPHGCRWLCELLTELPKLKLVKLAILG